LSFAGQGRTTIRSWLNSAITGRLSGVASFSVVFQTPGTPGGTTVGWLPSNRMTSRAVLQSVPPG
jgi:hypothetical protein